MKRILPLLAILLGGTFPARADHITGGEMYYTLVSSAGGNYQYRIVVKLFMRCNSGRQFNDPTIISIFEKGTNNRVRDHEVGLSRRETLRLNDPDKCITDPPVVCYEVGYYEFTTTLPPSANGYIVSSQFVFRIAGIRNLVPFYANIGTTYTCEIPGNFSGSGTPANNSARFTGTDLVAICANNEFSYSFAATDPDGDELRYTFCNAYQGGAFRMGTPIPPAAPPYESVPYGEGFSGSSPLGRNVRINPATGLLTGMAPDAGIYVVTVCVSEIRNGRVIATQRKDLQIYIAPCTVASASLQPAYDLCDSSSSLQVANQSSSPLIQTYNWELFDRAGNTLTSSTQTDFAHNFSDTGLFRLKLVINRNGNCADSTTSLVRVYPGMQANFTQDGVCAGRPIFFQDASTTRYGSLVQWQWDFGFLPTTTGRQTTITYGEQGQRSVSMTVTNSNGCQATASRTIDVVDKPLLELPFRDTLICAGDTLQLKALGAGLIRWWPDTQIRTPGSAEPVVAPRQTTTYFTELNSQGCLNQDSVLVRVVNRVELVSMPDTVICAGDTIQLRPASNALRYRWEPAAQVLDPESPLPRVVAASTTRFRVLASIGGCTAEAGVQVSTVPYPRSNAGADTSICFGSSVQLSGTAGGSRFSWSASPTLSDPSILGPVASPLTTTAYLLTVYDNQGCPKPGIDTVVVRVIPPVRADAGNDTSIVVGQPLQLQASGGTAYEWSPGTMLSATDIAGPVAVFPNEYAGEIRYLVKVSTPEGCSDTASVAVRVFATLPTVFVPTAFTPNGDGRNDLLRPIATGMQRVEQFSVFNRWGQLLYNDRNGRGWDGRINGQIQQTGVYVWMVRATDFRGKQVVQKGTAALLR